MTTSAVRTHPMKTRSCKMLEGFSQELDLMSKLHLFEKPVQKESQTNSDFYQTFETIATALKNTREKNKEQKNNNHSFFPLEGLRLTVGGTVENDGVEKKNVNFLIPGDLVTIPVTAYNTGRFNLKHYSVYLGKFNIQAIGGYYLAHYFLEYNIDEDADFKVSFKNSYDIEKMIGGKYCPKFNVRLNIFDTDTNNRNGPTPSSTEIVESILAKSLDFVEIKNIKATEKTVKKRLDTKISYRIFRNNCETFARFVTGKGTGQQNKLMKNFVNYMAKFVGQKYNKWKFDRSSKTCHEEKNCIYIDNIEKIIRRQKCKEGQTPCSVISSSDPKGTDVSKNWNSINLTECKFDTFNLPSDS